MYYADIRHRLHQWAEPSGEEIRTQKLILEELQFYAPTAIHTFDNSLNVVAEYDFGTGPTLLFRADFDAVRVPETLGVPYKSLTAGVSHKCGHDGHTAILLGLAEQFHWHPLSGGKVLLFFQAAEETGKGAGQLIETRFLESHVPDEVIALHNIPGLPLGTVICRPESFTCSVISCDIELFGQSSHAAEPLNAVSPYSAAKAITDKLSDLNRYDISKPDYQLITLIEFRVGEQAYGVAAGSGVLRFTLRAKEDSILQKLKLQVEEIVNQEVAKINGLSNTIEWKEYFAASRNDKMVVDQIKQAAEDNGLSYFEKEVPFSWGEDFGLLTQHYAGALFGLGSGEQQAPLHHPDFDFPDSLVPIGVSLFFTVAKQYLSIHVQSAHLE